jgi:hypothetical protein
VRYENAIKARIFISCGQKDAEEKAIAREIERGLINLGFEPYVAIHKQSTGSVIKNILNSLRDAEYYLFIDFKREQIISLSSKGSKRYNEDKSRPIYCRGSLFSNQELAIATYLGKPIIAFQESGVKTRDGILDAIQANIITSDNRDNLVNHVLEKVHTDWISNWRNEIIFQDTAMKQISAEHITEYGPSKLPARFFHGSMKNLHKDISARNCVAYLESYKVCSKRTLEADTEVISEPVELKWKGMKTQGVLIPPKTNRKFDAIFFYENNPHIVHIGINPFLVDLSSHFKQLEGTNTFELNYVVYSENFATIRCTYILEVGQNLNQTRFYRK